MTDSFFKNIHISNFKSLKDVTLSDCKRINLLIGKPNVGKSNILEAIGLFSLVYFKYNATKKITQFIRLENIEELFFDGFTSENISIITDNNCSCDISYKQHSIQINISETSKYFFESKNEWMISTRNHIMDVDKRFNPYLNYPRAVYPSSKVKLFKFPCEFILKKQRGLYQPDYLIPPFGINLLDAIQENKIDKDLSHIFSEYGLNLLLDKTSNALRIMKTLKETNTMVSFPYRSIADTLQRLIFYKTAIASNKNSILLFEEPEAHCFPPYIAHFTQDVLNSETNQFFIATHSPYVLNDFLEYKRDDVAIYMADFKDGQTVIYRLTDDEVNEVYDYGIDVFFNYERFTQHG